MLDRYYPKALMSELSLYLHRSLCDLHAVFPSQTAISVDNLLSFGQVRFMGGRLCLYVSSQFNYDSVFEDRCIFVC